MLNDKPFKKAYAYQLTKNVIFKPLRPVQPCKYKQNSIVYNLK